MNSTQGAVVPGEEEGGEVQIYLHACFRRAFINRWWYLSLNEHDLFKTKMAKSDFLKTISGKISLQ